MRHWLPKVGAVFYALWGLLHIWAGGAMLMADTYTQLDYLSTSPVHTEKLAVELEPVVHAALSFHSYNLLWFGLLALVVAVLLNWRNSVTGYWVNLVVVGADDLGLMWFLIIPGHLSFGEAGLGPVLFVLAFVFSTLGILDRKSPSQDVSQQSNDVNG